MPHNGRPLTGARQLAGPLFPNGRQPGTARSATNYCIDPADRESICLDADDASSALPLQQARQQRGQGLRFCLLRCVRWCLSSRPTGVARRGSSSPGHEVGTLLAPMYFQGRTAEISRKQTRHRHGRLGVTQQRRRAALRGSIRRAAVFLADDRFDRGDGPAPACA